MRVGQELALPELPACPSWQSHTGEVGDKINKNTALINVIIQKWCQLHLSYFDIL